MALPHYYSRAPSYPANCKPHYRSPMNYAYTYDSRVLSYSRGTLLADPLDPRAMDETKGLGTTDPVILQTMRELPWDSSRTRGSKKATPARG